MNVSLNSWTLIFLFAAAQGAFLSVLLLMLKKGVRLANNILSLVILLFSVSLVYYVAYWTGYEAKLHPIITITLSFVWLFGPLLLFYFKALNRSRPTAKWLWHLLPFGLVCLLKLAAIFNVNDIASNPAWWNSQAIGQTLTVLQLVHLFSYALIMYRYQKKHIYPKNIDKVQHKWLVIIVLFYVGFCVSFSSYYLLVWTGVLKIEYDYAISLVMSLFIYTVGYFGFKKPEMLANIDPSIKYEKSSLSKSASKALLEKVVLYMDKHQPYINSELKLTGLADQLGLSPNHLSQIINENLQQNFSDFINNYRVNHAKALLTNQDYSQEKIINIAYDSGFNNKVSFNAAFKKFEGISPSAFRKKKHPSLTNNYPL